MSASAARQDDCELLRVCLISRSESEAVLAEWLTDDIRRDVSGAGTLVAGRVQVRILLVRR